MPNQTGGEWMAAADLGSAHTRVLIAQRQHGGWQLAGSGQAHSRGVRRGQIVDIDAAAGSLKLALERAGAGLGLRLFPTAESSGGGPASNELAGVPHGIATEAVSGGGSPLDDAARAEMAGRGARPAVTSWTGGRDTRPAPKLWLGMLGGEAASHVVDASIELSQGRVRQQDVQACVAQLRNRQADPGREWAQVAPAGFAVQPDRWVADPLGRSGQQLATRGVAVSVPAGRGRAGTELAERAGLPLAGMGLSPLAAAAAVLEARDLSDGVALIDFGAGTVDVAVFVPGRPAWLASLRTGSDYITNDVALGLGIPWAVAEDLKCRYGRVDGATVQRSVEVEGDDVAKKVELSFLHEIVGARVDEMLEEAGRLLSEGLAGRSPGAGAVLCGGGALLRGLPKRAMELWHLPTRMGTPLGVPEEWPDLASPQGAAALGLLRQAGDARGAEVRRPPAASGALRDRPSLGRRVVSWLAEMV